MRSVWTAPFSSEAQHSLWFSFTQFAEMHKLYCLCCSSVTRQWFPLQLFSLIFLVYCVYQFMYHISAFCVSRKTTQCCSFVLNSASAIFIKHHNRLYCTQMGRHLSPNPLNKAIICQDYSQPPALQWESIAGQPLEWRDKKKTLRD